MTYDEWKKLKGIRRADNQKIIRDFERRNPGLAALYEKREREELSQMRDIMKESDRMERWRQLAKVAYDPEFAARRRYEEM